MKILHLFSDWKWTGPAEPVLDLCGQLQKRGHEVLLAYRKPQLDRPRTIASMVRERGINATDNFHLNRYFSWTDNPTDIVRLRRLIRDHQFQVINTHLSHDNALGGLAARLAGRQAVVVRTDHLRDSFARTITNRFLLRRLSDGVVTFSESARARLVESFGLDTSRVLRVNPAVDAERFSPAKGRREFRTELGIAPGDVVVGVVGRFQKYRKMDLFFEGLRRAVAQAPNIKALIVGRGSHMEETIHQPIARLGLKNHVVLGGYLMDRYLDGLASMDMFVFLIAGSDGTGRALRQAMAMGKPVIVNKTGMLPEMINVGRNGLLFDNDPQQLAEHLVKLARNPELREAMGKAALEKARDEFSVEAQASAIEGFYEQLLERKAHSMENRVPLPASDVQLSMNLVALQTIPDWAFQESALYSALLTLIQ